MVAARYVGISLAATYLGISIKALEMRIQRRTIPFIKDGKRIKFDLLAIDKYMAERTVAFKPFIEDESVPAHAEA